MIDNIDTNCEKENEFEECHIAQELVASEQPSPNDLALDVDPAILSRAHGEGSPTEPVAPIKKATRQNRGSPVVIHGSDLFECHDGAQEFVVDGLIPSDGLALLVGRPKSGKSFMFLQLARAVSEGELFLGRSTQKPRRVLYLALEDGRRRMYRRTQAIGWTPANVHFVFKDFSLSDKGIEWLREQSQQYDMILIDTLNAACGGLYEENDNGEMGNLFSKLGNIAHETRTSIVIAHHSKKGVTDDLYDGVRGASAVRAGCDLVIFLTRPNNSRTATLCVESRDVEVPNMTLTFDPGTWWSVCEDAASHEPDFPGSRVFKALQVLGPKTTIAKIASYLDSTTQAVGQQLKELIKERRVIREYGPGSGSKPTSLWSIAT